MTTTTTMTTMKTKILPQSCTELFHGETQSYFTGSYLPGAKLAAHNDNHDNHDNHDNEDNHDNYDNYDNHENNLPL